MADAPRTVQAPRSRKFRRLWYWLGGGSLLLLAAGLYLTFSQNSAVVEYRALARFYSSKREVRAFLEGFGPYAPLVFILLQSLQVVLAPIPGEVTGFLGGFVFGTGLGFVYSTIGLTLGSILAFGLGRRLGLPLVRRIVSEETYHRFDFMARTGGELVTLLCFLFPGFPKDYLCFLLGMSPLPFGTFFIITLFGRMPGTWLLSIQGAKVRGARYLEFVIILTTVAAAALLVYHFRERIFQWMRQRHGAGAGQAGSGERKG